MNDAPNTPRPNDESAVPAGSVRATPAAGRLALARTYLILAAKYVWRWTVWLWHRSRELTQRAWRSQRWQALLTRLRSRSAAAWRASAAWWDRGAPLKRLRRPVLRVARVALFTVVFTGLLWSTQKLWIHDVPPGRIGVRQVVWGDAGVIPRDFAPGFSFALKGRSHWHHVPAGTRLFSFAEPTRGGQYPPLAIATRDGEPFEVSVSVPYRVEPGSAWRLVADGLRLDYEKRAVQILRRVLSEELSKLSTEEWSDPVAREAATSGALEALRGEDEFGGIHLRPEAVLIVSVDFHPGYEKKLLEKQLELQTRRTNESLAARAAVQLELVVKQHELAADEARLVALRDTDIERMRIELEDQSLAVTRALGDYRAERRLAGDAAVATAKLAGDLALAEADEVRGLLERELLDSAGGRLHLAVEAAKNLRFNSVRLNSNDPRVPQILDLDQMVELLVGSGD